MKLHKDTLSSGRSIFIGSRVDHWGYETNGGRIRLSRIDLPLGGHFPENSIFIGSRVDQWGFETNGGRIPLSRIDLPLGDHFSENSIFIGSPSIKGTIFSFILKLEIARGKPRTYRMCIFCKFPMLPTSIKSEIGYFP
jgi:hypothetical protein